MAADIVSKGLRELVPEMIDRPQGRNILGISDLVGGAIGAPDRAQYW
jgi:hypothetical protein